MKMNRYLIMALLLAICGIALMGYSVSSGESSAGVFFIIPIFYGSGISAFLGVLCIMAAIFLGFVGFAASAVGDEGYEPSREPQGSSQGRAAPKKTIKGGGVVMIGPIPIIFGSDSKSAKVVAILAIILMIIMMVFMFMFFLR